VTVSVKVMYVGRINQIFMLYNIHDRFMNIHLSFLLYSPKSSLLRCINKSPNAFTNDPFIVQFELNCQNHIELIIDSKCYMS